MATKLPPNTHRNRYGILYFRIAVPRDLRPYFDTAEIYKSLQTRSNSRANYNVLYLTAAFKQLFTRLRHMTIFEQDLSVYDFVDEYLKLPDLRLRLKNAGQKIMLAEQDVELSRLESQLINQEESRRQEQDIYNRTLERLGKVITSSHPVQLVDNGRNISDYVHPYVESIRSRRKPPGEQTITSYEVSARLFIEIIGDKPLHELSHKDRNRYDETIFRIPKNRQKMPATRGKTIAEMLLIPNLELLSPATVKDEALRANLFLDWIFHHEGAKPPFILLEKFKAEKADARQRRPFNDDELRLVFNPSILCNDRRPSPYKFWLTLVGLHTGARINEIAQLDLADIISVDGISCFNFTDELDQGVSIGPGRQKKRLKTEAGKRIVPIHSHLIELGLLEYVNLLREEGHVMLFPDLAHAKKNYGSLASKWFAHNCDRIGLKDPALTFHSFRHGATTLLAKKNVQRELRKVIVGHSHHDDVHDHYIHLAGMFSVFEKQQAIELLDFSNVIDYSGLKKIAPTLKELRQALARNGRAV